MKLFNRRRRHEIDPDEIFLDSSNIAHMDEAQFEGRVEHPVSRVAIVAIGFVFVIGMFIFAGQAFTLQVLNGETYADISRENRLARAIVFATRGIIYDRTGKQLAWNDASEAGVATTTDDHFVEREFARRRYTELDGLAHLLGFVRYPKKDESGAWWREEYTGVSGVELVYDEALRGQNGSRLIETDAVGALQRAHIVLPPVEGTDLKLSIDAEVQSELYKRLSAHAENQGFRGGAAVIMDVRSGEILALTSFPEYDNAAFTDGDTAAIQDANIDPRTPLLNRAVAGLYTPGSIVKPLFAAAALEEGIIDPEKEILSTGKLVVPNPYNPDEPTIFRDWKAHGYTDMRRAIAVSSDVYFYTIGGGFGGQQGLGISRLDEYAQKFGLSSLSGIPLLGELAGTIPTPEWKEKVFDGDPWRLGDTYITSIGQFGFQITPIQAVRFTAAIANGGQLLKPHLTTGPLEAVPVGSTDEHLQIVREGMRAAVTDGGTAAALNIAGIEIAGKTGTAELGERNQFMNSWVVGFWPASKPKYAFAVVLERAPAGTLSGASPGMSQFFYWLVQNKPEYVE